MNVLKQDPMYQGLGEFRNKELPKRVVDETKPDEKEKETIVTKDMRGEKKEEDPTSTFKK